MGQTVPNYSLIYTNKNSQRDNSLHANEDIQQDKQPIELVDSSAHDITYVASKRQSGKKMIRITNKEIRRVKHPYYRQVQSDLNPQDKNATDLQEQEEQLRLINNYHNYNNNLALNSNKTFGNVKSKVRVWNIRQEKQEAQLQNQKNMLQRSIEKENCVPSFSEINSGTSEIKDQDISCGDDDKYNIKSTLNLRTEMPLLESARARNISNKKESNLFLKTINESKFNQIQSDTQTQRYISLSRTNQKSSQSTTRKNQDITNQSASHRSFAKENQLFKIRNPSIPNIKFPCTSSITQSQTPSIYTTNTMSRPTLRANYESILENSDKIQHQNQNPYLNLIDNNTQDQMQNTFYPSVCSNTQLQTQPQRSLNLTSPQQFMYNRNQNNLNQKSSQMYDNQQNLKNMLISKTQHQSKEDLFTQHQQINQELLINLNRRMQSTKISHQNSSRKVWRN
eukprot:403338618